jgi:hypothetical protein
MNTATWRHPSVRRVVQKEKLPREQRHDNLSITHGYAVCLYLNHHIHGVKEYDVFAPINGGENVSGHWLFFETLPPAWVFLRSARMANEKVEGEIYAAANEIRWKEHLHHDVLTLFVAKTAFSQYRGGRDGLDLGAEITAVWVQGNDERTKSWQSAPASKELKALTKRVERLN